MAKADANLRARRIENFLTKSRNKVTKKRKVRNTREKGFRLGKLLAASLNAVPRCEAFWLDGSHDGGRDVAATLFGHRCDFQCKNNNRWGELYALVDSCGGPACVKNDRREPLMVIPMRMWIDHLEFINVHPPKITDYP